MKTTPTITDYRPGIYAEIFAREKERAEREARWEARLDFAADVLLAGLALVWLAWAAWFTLHALAR